MGAIIGQLVEYALTLEVTVIFIAIQRQILTWEYNFLNTFHKKKRNIYGSIVFWSDVSPLFCTFILNKFTEECTASLNSRDKINKSKVLSSSVSMTL